MTGRIVDHLLAVLLVALMAVLVTVWPFVLTHVVQLIGPHA